jgi:hypothetical protein
MQTLRKRVLFVLAALVIPLAGCEYGSPAEGPRQSSPQASTAQPRSFEENVDAVARLLEVSTSDPGMPSEAESAGELSIVLAPGDYTVKAACAGVHGAKLTIVKGEGLPEATPYTCDSTLERFVRHAGGPITISAIPPTGRPAATGVTVQPNTEPRASELEDMREWALLQLKPDLPRQLAGSASSNTATSSGFVSAGPGNYEVHFICEGPPEAQLSVSTSAGAEVLAPVQVPCNGDVFKAPVELATQGADLHMDPGNGPEGRYAFRLVPSGESLP